LILLGFFLFRSTTQKNIIAPESGKNQTKRQNICHQSVNSAIIAQQVPLFWRPTL